MLVNRYRRSYHRLRSLVRHQVERLKRNAISMHAHLLFFILYPESSTFKSLLLRSFMVDISIVSCGVMRAFDLSFTGGLSTGTATYTGDWRPVIKEELLLVKRDTSTKLELGFTGSVLNLSIALGV